jgi:hypothetical protein
MARTKKYAAKNETHSKTTLNNRNPRAMKKNGAGKGNWGTPSQDFTTLTKTMKKNILNA